MTGTATDFRVVPLAELLTQVPAQPGHAAWDAASVAVLPPRLGRPYLRPGDCRVVVASVAGRPIGLLPLLRGTSGQTPPVLRDPGPRIAAFLPADHGDLLFVGGCVDLVAGAAVASDLTDVERRSVRRGLVDQAWHEALRDGLVPLALHVRDTEVADFLGPGRRAVEIGVTSVLRLPADGSDAAYLAGLGQNGRRTVLKDRRQVAHAGLRSAVLPAADLTAAAADLVVAVKQRYGVEEHPRLVRARLERWAADPAGERVAFSVSDATGPVAVTFGCARGTCLEIYETGLAASHPHRHEAYVESLFQAPIAFARARGITEIDLGLDAATPKTRRGATLAPTWAVGPEPVRSQTMDTTIADIVRAEWCEVLDVTSPDPGDDFFEVGGNSLLAVTLVERVESRLGVEVALEEFFLDGRLDTLVSVARAAAK